MTVDPEVAKNTSYIAVTEKECVTRKKQCLIIKRQLRTI